MFRKLLSFIAILLVAHLAIAHDTWLQPNAHIVRIGDSIHLDVMLGNHGNEHRDFKLAGKPDLESSKLTLFAPDNKTLDLKPTLIDQALAPKEGYFTTRFVPSATGLHLLAYTSDKVVTPTRSIHSAKTFFLASKSLDNPPADVPGFDRVLKHALELVPKSNPVAPMGPGSKIAVQLLFQGKPLADARISFIPRGVTLAENFDPKYERKTDSNGLATFEPPDGNYYLIAAHHADPNAKGEGYTSTKYSATLTVLVPSTCPCCGE
jgi:uncharacterized GH25 family protein